ncbi:hypothetical protein [Lysinibacillus contaminans]|uniref:hypothetical protein n=1 Tax=Lysinibacillus contaminans TaxID=1293441 RepID=UPI000AC75C3C|nr:hypothetical protein [Lysinibacillus contaminans]
MRKKKLKELAKNFIKDIVDEVSGTIVFEIIWNILMFIPKIMIRFVKFILD